MSRTLMFVSVVACLFVTPGAIAQRWLSRLPQKPAREMAFRDYQQAFESYYKDHPVDLKLDKLRPTFKFEGAQEIRNRVDIEEYKMFKRWEWFTEPRVYPGGSWDFEKIDSATARLENDDNDLVLKQVAVNPLKLKFIGSKIIWPLLKFWNPLGPSDAVGGTNMGRVNCIEFDPTNAKTIYIGAPDGGIWKSTDAGTTWTPKFDFQPTLSVGDIAIDPKTPSVIYVSTSDAFGYGSPFWGGTYSVGVRKSTDGGNTWAATGLSWTVGQNRTIRRLVINPSNSMVLLAATSDGVYRTNNAGATWNQVVTASAFDAEFQQNDGKIAYVTTSQVLKSTDAGATFSALTASGCSYRYNIEIARSNPKTLYTLCTSGTVQKSTDAGSTWTTVTAPGVFLFGYYDNVLAVSPINENIVYVAGFDMKRTTDGGNTWNAVATAGHVDNHCIEFSPGSRPIILCGNDGGLFKTVNAGTSWTSLNNGLSITQFYRLGISKTSPGTMICGAQDNGNMKYSAGTFTNVTNADGMDGFIDWNSSNNIYAGIQNGGFYRSTNGGTSFTNISTPGTGAWIAPWCQHPTVANTIFAGTDKVYKSTDQGSTWTAISGSLAGIWAYTVLKVAPSNPNFIYAGNGHKLYRTMNGGSTWVDITAGLPVGSNYLMDLAIHDYDPSIVYVTFSGYNAGQKVYRTCDCGNSWTNMSGTLPNMPVNCIVHQNTNNALYVGTDAGVYYINENLSDWIPYKFGLPNVIVDDLEIHYGTKTIRAATYGRGIWQAPLR